MIEKLVDRPRMSTRGVLSPLVWDDTRIVKVGNMIVEIVDRPRMVLKRSVDPLLGEMIYGK